MTNFKVTNITAGYDRKRQPAQYESAGASLSFSASRDISLGDGDDYLEVGQRLLAEAKKIVLTEIGIIKPDGGTSTPAPGTPKPDAKPVVAENATATSAKVAEKTEDKATAKKDAKAKADKDKPKSSDISGDDKPVVAAKPSSDIPGDEAPAKTAEPAKAAASSDIPSDVRAPASGTAPTGSLDAASVQLWVTEIIRKGKINSAQVREIMEGEPFKVSRLRDLGSAELLTQFRKTIADKAGVTL